MGTPVWRQTHRLPGIKAKYMKGGEAYEGTKKEHLNCANNLSVRYGYISRRTINLYVLL